MLLEFVMDSIHTRLFHSSLVLFALHLYSMIQSCMHEVFMSVSAGTTYSKDSFYHFCYCFKVLDAALNLIKKPSEPAGS